MAQEIKAANPYANNPIQTKVMIAPTTNSRGVQARCQVLGDLKRLVSLVSTALSRAPPPLFVASN